jgi:acetyl esterase/lipase
MVPCRSPAVYVSHVAVSRTQIAYGVHGLMLIGVILTAAPAAASASLADGQEILLWPGPAPGSAKVTREEKIEERSRDPAHPDRAVTGITRPALTAFVPAKPNGSALIVASGGGYQREVIDKEGIEVARSFAPRGTTVFLLKYRLPDEGHDNGRDVPLQDGQRAVRLVRTNARRWNIDPGRIGVMGFSAGGHLAAYLGARFAAKVADPVDEIDRASARPDFLILMYPVVSMEDGLAHGGSRRALLGSSPGKDLVSAYSADRQVDKTAPRTLLVLADDDTAVLPENSIRYYQALKRAGVPAELHIFAQGGHGFGVGKAAAAGLPVGNWPNLAWAWMLANGIVGK